MYTLYMCRTNAVITLLTGTNGRGLSPHHCVAGSALDFTTSRKSEIEHVCVDSPVYLIFSVVRWLINFMHICTVCAFYGVMFYNSLKI